LGNKFSPQLTDEQKAIGLELRKQGKEYSFIADQLGLDVGFLRKRLPQHIKLVCPHLMPPSKRHKVSTRVRLTAADVHNYNHNDNNDSREDRNGIILRVDINPDTDSKATEPIAKLKDGPQSGHCEIVIGSKWNKSPELFATAKQDSYSTSVKRMVRHG